MKTTYVEQIDHFEEESLKRLISSAEHLATANMAMQENEQVFENLHVLTGK